MNPNNKGENKLHYVEHFMAGNFNPICFTTANDIPARTDNRRAASDVEL